MPADPTNHHRIYECRGKPVEYLEQPVDKRLVLRLGNADGVENKG